MNMIRVHSYESMGTFDGPGLRLVVFLQGCPFRCLYCANPDTIDLKGESKETSPQEILEMAVSQKPFYGKKGGITFSGGEPTLQAEALIPLFQALRTQGIHICLDSNGGIWNEHVETLLGLTDLVLLDVKQINPERHRLLTGRSNEQTLRTAAWLEEHNRPFWLRYVLVPGYSDAEEDIRRLGETLGLTLDQMNSVEALNRTFRNDMMTAAQAGDTERKELLAGAVAKDIRYMSYVLTPEQLGKYETLINTTLTNRGIEK